VLWFANFEPLIPLRDGPCHAVLRGSFAIPFANIVFANDPDAPTTIDMIGVHSALLGLGTKFHSAAPYGCSG
jgi:hypothetical protein